MNRLTQTEGLAALVDESADRLRHAGWSAGDMRLASGLWLVTATNGENAVAGQGECQAEAWQQAAEAARAVGMLDRSNPDT
jgi:hypothetical protein